MSLNPKPHSDIPSETLRVARAAFPNGNALMTMRDELGGLFSEEQFADLFPVRGQSAESPRVLALVLIFQIMECLTDTCLHPQVQAGKRRRQCGVASTGNMPWVWSSPRLVLIFQS